MGAISFFVKNLIFPDDLPIKRFIFILVFIRYNGCYV